MATVLVIEDERKLRDLLRSYLERGGLSVLSAGNGAEGLSIATTAARDLVRRSPQPDTSSRVPRRCVRHEVAHGQYAWADTKA